MKKKILIFLIVTCVLVGAGWGGIHGYLIYKDDHTFANVIPVSTINSGYMGQDMQMSGTVTNDMAQNVYLKDSQTVAKVFVKEGDSVKIGDPLLKYDVTSVQLSIEMKQLEIQGIQNDTAIANRDLVKLQNTKPVDKTPPKVEPATDTESVNDTETDTEDSQQTGDAYNYIDKEAKPFAGDGSSASPFRYLCTKKCYVTGEVMQYLKENKYYAIFEIHVSNIATNALLTSWTVNGNAIAKAPIDSEWYILDQSTDNNIGDSTETHMQDTQGTIPQDTTETETETEIPDGYTKEELAKAIADKQNDLKALDIKVRTAQLELKKLQNQLKDANVYASINGTVKTVEDPNNLPNDGSAFLSVYGSDGLYVKGQVNELLLDQVKVGQEVNVTSWQSGGSYKAKITEISTYPDTNSGMYYGGNGNPNSSYYDFTSYIEDSQGLSNGESVSLSMSVDAQQNTNSLYIDKAYVRKSNGKYYVLKEGKKKRLVKQTVVTGKTYYGSLIEVKSGISQDDNIAFPYGKIAKEGIRTKKTDTTNYGQG